MKSSPLKDIVGTAGTELSGKKIVLGITGSVAASRSPEIARELMRHGAEVYAVMTEAATKIIHPNLMEWATGSPVVTQLTGRTEHIELMGSWEGKSDLLLIAPSTANTIGKIAAGIDDNPVTTMTSVALGNKIPIIVAPGMHEPMYSNPMVKENIEKLKELGVEFVEPTIEEGKAKIAPTEQIVKAVIQKLGPKDMEGLRVLVTSGPTVEYIDPVRVITNRSSGKMGVALAEEAATRGAEVTLVVGAGVLQTPSGVRTVHVSTTDQLRDAVMRELRQKRYDMVISAAAPADFKPDTTYSTKVSTRETKGLKISLSPTVKVIEEVKKVSPGTLLVAFKAEYRLSKERLIDSATQLLTESRADLVVANDVGRKGIGFEADTNEVYLVDRGKNVTHVPLAPKGEIAQRIVDTALALLSQKT